MSTTPKDLVERFYSQVWNEADESVAREILDVNFRFRGSLGLELHGQAGFISYLRLVHGALENFVCNIEDLITTQDRAAARMSFHGTHRGRFFGVEATDREILWSGAAFFRVRDDVITELWVLGDIDAVKRQLMPDVPTPSFLDI